MVHPDEFRRRYERLSDEALIDAYGLGSGSYQPQAWEVISKEMAARGLRSESVPAEPPNGQPASELTARTVVEYLNAGLAPATIRERLQATGLSALEVDQHVVPVLAQWRLEEEKRAGQQMMWGALWGIGGLLVTVFTYSAAEQAGGQYVVAWGAILFGAIRFVKGLTRSQRARQEWPTASQGQ